MEVEWEMKEGSSEEGSFYTGFIRRVESLGLERGCCFLRLEMLVRLKSVYYDKG